MTQHVDIILDEMPTRYTRTDFTALRAYLNKIPANRIGDLYYSEDDLEDRGLNSEHQLAKFLDGMRDDLIARLQDANPGVADSLRQARRSFTWGKKAIDFLIAAADQKQVRPKPADPVSVWFKPIAAKRLQADDLLTCGDLIHAIRTRGKGWYRSVPCIGAGKADKIVDWLRQHAASLGPLPDQLVDRDALDPRDLVLGQGMVAFAPLERIRVPDALSGRFGENRNPLRPLCEARDDLAAIKSYIDKFADRPKTYRAYRKELERFLAWSVAIHGKALSSLLVEDCRAYVAFMNDPADSWCGQRQARTNPAWRPFAGPLSKESQSYAIQVINGCFNYLVKLRYLGGNPWAGVNRPAMVKRLKKLQIGKAIPSELWAKLTDEDGILDALCQLTSLQLMQRFQLSGKGTLQNMAAQMRLVRAIILTLGITGMRREELAYAIRRELHPMPTHPGMWKLKIVGKRLKERFVFLTERAIDALRQHWDDRGDDFSFGLTDYPLVSPVTIPRTAASKEKHETGPRGAKGFSPDGIYTAVTGMLAYIADDPTLDLSEDERQILRTRGIHAFRHTFGTLAVADGMPIDIIKDVMGHSSLTTTSIYVNTEEDRAAEAVSAWATKRQKKSRI